MKTFLKTLTLFSLPVILGFLSYAEYLSRRNYLPLITTNLCFDAKLNEVRKHNFNSLDIIAVGSSMTLNNLNSDVINKYTNRSYYNFGAWGLQISQIEKLVEIYVTNFNPKYVIICSQINDFNSKYNFKIISKPELNWYINGGWQGYFFIKKLNIQSLDQRMHDLEIDRKDNTHDGSLLFDDNGGISLDIPKTKINIERWNEKPFFNEDKSIEEYKSLSHLSSYLNEKNINLIFVQCPTKKGFIETSLDKNRLGKHIQTCKLIIEKNGNYYLDFSNYYAFNDTTYFLDQTHLKQQGAQVFTQLIIDSLEKKGVIIK